MIQPYDLVTALDLPSLMLFFWFTLLFDVPRYILSAIALACVPWHSPPPKRYSTSAVVAGHNEAKTVRQCVCSLEVDEIIVVDDGSTDDMWLEVQRLKEEGIITHAIRLPSRQSKPAAVNTGLALCTGEIVLIIDADTVLAPGAVAAVLGYFSAPKVGGVNFNLQVRNEGATLTTWFQAIEYSIAVSAGKRMADALGILPNVSGAAGAFRRTALEQVGGQDIEVAEDAALSMKRATRAGSCDSRPTRSPAPLRRRPWSPCCCNDCDGIRASSRFGGESTPAISIRSSSISASPTCGPILTCCGSPRSCRSSYRFTCCGSTIRSAMPRSRFC
jgi:poly-beta-1,6-N-acetyl-D-glucosamine synthase